MENFKSHKREIFWYNIHVPRERSSTFFDIGGRHPAPAISPKPVWADGKTPVGRNHRARRSGELRKRIRRPQHIRNISVLGFVAKPLTLHNEKPNAMVRRVVIHAAYPLFLFFVKVLSGTCHETGFRGCAAFLFRAKAAVSGMVGAERR